MGKDVSAILTQSNPRGQIATLRLNVDCNDHLILVMLQFVELGIGGRRGQRFGITHFLWIQKQLIPIIFLIKQPESKLLVLKIRRSFSEGKYLSRCSFIKQNIKNLQKHYFAPIPRMKKKTLDQIVNKQRKSAKKYQNASQDHQRTYYSSTKSQSFSKSSNFKRIGGNISNIKEKKSNVSKQFSEGSLEYILNPERSRFETFNPFKDLEVKALHSKKPQKFFTEIGDQLYTSTKKFNQMRGKHRIIKPFSHIQKKKVTRIQSEKTVESQQSDLRLLIATKYKMNIEEIAKIEEWAQILKELSCQKPGKSKEIKLLLNQLNAICKRKQLMRDQEFRLISKIVQ